MRALSWTALRLRTRIPYSFAGSHNGPSRAERGRSGSPRRVLFAVGWSRHCEPAKGEPKLPSGYQGRALVWTAVRLQTRILSSLLSPFVQAVQRSSGARSAPKQTLPTSRGALRRYRGAEPLGWLLLLVPLVSPACASLPGGTTPFIGGVVGISTLSADGRAIVTDMAADISLYKPENGAAANLLAGLHITDYLSAQANYVWNRNDLTLTSSHGSEGRASFFEERRTSDQHALVGDALLYFRNRESWARPYLSAGFGLVRFRSAEPMLVAARDQPARPATSIVSTTPALRVAVGLDILVARGWSLRYSFSETLRHNAVSQALSPAAQRNLANFQNLFGATKSF
jgi:hypothetical protein